VAHIIAAVPFQQSPLIHPLAHLGVIAEEKINSEVNSFCKKKKTLLIRKES